jgi:hypothetical protein
MPILRRRSHPATTDQPAGTGAVPGQRGTPEGSTVAEQTEAREAAAREAEAREAEARQAAAREAEAREAEARQAAAREAEAREAEARQAEARQAEARQAAASAEPRGRARRPYYGMAGTLMFLSGLLTFFIGITGIIRGTFFNNVANYPFYYSIRSRGITLLVIGSVAIVVGLALLIHMHWARTVGTVVAVVNAVANFMFLPFYPFWSIVVLTLNVLIIWELTRERGERGTREFARLPGPARAGRVIRFLALLTRAPGSVFPSLLSRNTLVYEGFRVGGRNHPDAAGEAVTMTENSRAPHKLSVVGAWKRVVARFRRGSKPPAMTEDYRRATEHNRSVQALQREEYGNATMRGWGGQFSYRLPGLAPVGPC